MYGSVCILTVCVRACLCALSLACVFLPEAWRKGVAYVCVVALVGRQCSALESVPGWVEAPWEKQCIQIWGRGLGWGRSQGREPLACVSLRSQLPPPLELERRSKRGGDWEEE